ncbi:unnamed protein product, partial [Rotaria magnacalcarata]
ASEELGANTLSTVR